MLQSGFKTHVRTTRHTSAPLGVLDTTVPPQVPVFSISFIYPRNDCICGQVVRVLGYRSGGPGSIPGTSRFSGGEKKKKTVVGLELGPLSLVSTTEELLDGKVAAPVYKTEKTAAGIRHADHVALSIRTSWQSLRRQAVVARSV
jgi:hypothetical protein